MQQPLQITFRGMEPSEAVEEVIRSKAEELERHYDRITSCRVTVEAPHRQHQKGNLFAVRLDIRVPEKEIVVDRERRHDHAHEDIYVAIGNRFAAAARQLEEYARKRRGETKRHTIPTHGTVRQIFPEEGYGFVELTDRLEVYFHENSVANGSFAELIVGDEVRVVVAEGEGEKGPQASTISPIGKHHLLDEPAS